MDDVIFEEFKEPAIWKYIWIGSLADKRLPGDPANPVPWEKLLVDRDRLNKMDPAKVCLSPLNFNGSDGIPNGQDRWNQNQSKSFTIYESVGCRLPVWVASRCKVVHPGEQHQTSQ